MSGGAGPEPAVPGWLQEVAARLEEVAQGAHQWLATPFDTPQLRVERGALRAVCRELRAAGFTMCLDVGGVDYLSLGRRPRFEVVYHFLSLGGPHPPRRLRLRVPVPEEDPRVDTISDLWPAAGWAEREVYDLFGISFQGHPDLRRILLPEDWEGFPLRRDYPLRGPRAAEAAARPAGENFDFLAARRAADQYNVRRPPPPPASPGGGAGA